MAQPEEAVNQFAVGIQRGNPAARLQVAKVKWIEKLRDRQRKRHELLLKDGANKVRQL